MQMLLPFRRILDMRVSPSTVSLHLSAPIGICVCGLA